MSPKQIGWTGLIILLSSFVFIFMKSWIFILTIAIGVILLIIAGNISGNDSKEEELKNREKILKLLGFNHINFNNIIFSLDGTVSLSFNESQEEIYITNHSSVKKYNFSDIVESRIDENGQSIIKTSRGSQIGGAIVGGILAGGVGAIVGGLGGEKKTDLRVNSLDLVVIIDDVSHPIWKIKLFESITSYGASSSDKKYKDAKEIGEKWHTLISVFIRRTDNKNKVSN